MGGRSITGTGVELTLADRYHRTHQGAFNTEGPIYVDISTVEGWTEEKGMMQRLLWALENECTSAGYLLWMKERGGDLRKRPVALDCGDFIFHPVAYGVGPLRYCISFCQSFPTDYFHLPVLLLALNKTGFVEAIRISRLSHPGVKYGVAFLAPFSL